MAPAGDATGPGAEGFGGDDFSNNLFSDLAPLLTLFGEQVTKQFLSMSLGWADNFLLAMGPLASSLPLSARYVLVETSSSRPLLAVAEQELLSSTSQNVCEMWSGQQIVRMVGSSEGMETLTIDRNGKILDVREAFEQDVIDEGWGRDECDAEVLESLRNAAPNLALNVQNATAPSWELWSWVALGVLLQSCALVVPGVATYCWKWTKAGGQTPEYGYPCFCIGTVCLVAGMLGCGHVIEGVTTEYEFGISPKGREQGIKIFRLQKARTVGDQRLPSCVIWNAEDNESIKISRLNNRDFSSLASISTATAVAGYIVQFVGLRALHCSATILQLGVALIMTCIRSWVRRGLASGPLVSSLPQGHELAWLALYTATEAKRSIDKMNLSAASSTHSGSVQTREQLNGEAQSLEIGTSRTEGSFLNSTNEGGSVLWELVLGHLQLRPREVDWIRGNSNPTRTDQSYRIHQLFSPIHGPWKSSLQFFGSDDMEISTGEISDETPLHAYQAIRKSMSANDTNSTVSAISDAFSTIMENIIEALSETNTVIWRNEGLEVPTSYSYHNGVAEMWWTFNVVNCQLRDYHKPLRTQQALRLRLQRLNKSQELSRDGGTFHWKLVNRDTIRAVLSLSIYTMAVRSGCIEESTLRTMSRTRPRGLASGNIPRRNLGSINRVGRIVGHARDGHDEKGKVATLKDWLNMDIDSINWSSRQRVHNAIEYRWYLGMFLSSLSDSETSQSPPDEASARELLIESRHKSDTVLICAQELLSLFMLAIASKIDKILGTTTRAQGGRSDRPRLTNTIFRMIADEVVRGRLAEDIDEAYTLVIPAFAKYNLLPTDISQEEDASTTAGHEWEREAGFANSPR
ncbi:hypothetical protein NM208_g653 [Fusarium decemcellulare]|uniref:Uncharacterized protein n=1 Tax=Fusarium decemcellulare TaxID=57161 RepID=A0ACC1SYK9_9HYPO|nr:hypothetical protein NM208_g653 [Fusarium decemcellulare]